jgi:DNA-binding GntR family transcriptional regulator
MDLIFCGDRPPGSKLVEEQLAGQLGVSRVPVRESLAKLVGQGMLVGGGKGESVRIRDYSPDDVRQLYEYREVLEGVAARAAAQVASATDIARLEIICKQAAQEIPDCHDQRWQELDQYFHFALADASHNRRIIPQLRMLVTECRYVFFVFPHPSPDSQHGTEHLQSVQQEHLGLLELIKSHDAHGAENRARSDMRNAAQRVMRLMIEGDLNLG